MTADELSRGLCVGQCRARDEETHQRHHGEPHSENDDHHVPFMVAARDAFSLPRSLKLFLGPSESPRPGWQTSRTVVATCCHAKGWHELKDPP
jgi:hypothetical protein